MPKTKSRRLNAAAPALPSARMARMDIAAKGEGREDDASALPHDARTEILSTIAFLEDFGAEFESAFELSSPNPYLAMAAHLIRHHIEAKPVTQTSLLAASGVPYATATRRLKEMFASGFVEARPRTRTGKSVSLHPSARLIESWTRLSRRVRRVAAQSFSATSDVTARDYYFGGSYMFGRSIQAPRVLAEPLKLAGGVRILVHGDPTFMVMENLKRQFELIVGCKIHQRAFSIDRLREEALRNVERKVSRYDIIAVDLPWLGEFVAKGVLAPLDDIMDVSRLDPADFHTAGWRATHWVGRPYGVPSQTTPELLFYRKDLFAEAGLEPPQSVTGVLEAARILHKPSRGRFGIAWNAARGTALGHTFMMTCADFSQPILNLRPIAGGFDADRLDRHDLRATIDTEAGLEAAEYLRSLLSFSPPDILSMSWYERIRPYAAGKVALAYGYTLLAPYFELDPTSPAFGQTGYMPHPAGRAGVHPIAPVGGYMLGIPANIAPERRDEAVEALVAFTSPEAQKLYVENGSRTAPRYSVGSDPEVRRMSSIFEAVDAMSWRDELQFWPRPPVPEISEIIQICGEELHDMLRGLATPKAALAKAQKRADQVMKNKVSS